MKKLNLEKKAVVRCEVCGDFHNEEDCEIIVIKIVKGKNCPLVREKIYSQTIQMIPEKTFGQVVPIVKESTTEEKTEKQIDDAAALREKLKDPNVVKILTPEEKTELLKKRRSGIPPAFLNRMPGAPGNVFIPPDNPDSERSGARYRMS